MRAKLMLFLMLFAMGLAAAALTGCKEEKESLSPASTLLILNAGQQSFFPEIPKGVAE
ncbi:MAG: hypothetical protein JXA07_11805 [Spirochaetes bacterium]|nr:hypothetical protein [Spirochaetota bacterium]